MPDLSEAKNEAKINELKSILLQIMYNTGEGGDSQQAKYQSYYLSYVPSIFKAMSSKSAEKEKTAEDKESAPNEEGGDTTANVGIIKDNSFEIVNLMTTLSNKQDAIESKQDDYFSDLVANTADFVDESQDDEKEGLISKLVGNVKGAITGVFSSIFSPRPKTVILAKSSIKDIAGVVKASGEAARGGTFKDKLKNKAAEKTANLIESLSGVIKKVGDAIAAGVKGIALALKIFVYVIFPLVLIGAVALLVVGLYFIAKYAINAIERVLGPVLNTIADSVKIVATGIGNLFTGIGEAIKGYIPDINGFVDKVAGIINHSVDKLVELLSIPMNAIANVIQANADKFGAVIEGVGKGINLVVDIVGEVWGAVKGIAQGISNFLSGSGIAKAAVEGAKNIAFKGIEKVSNFFSGDKDKDKEESKINFSSMTEPMCRAINDFAHMVEGYLKNITVGNPYQTVRTNISGAEQKVDRMGNVISSSNNSSSKSSSKNNSTTNISNNTSTSTDGAPNKSFNNSTINKFDYSYNSNALNNQSNVDNTEVVKLLKLQNDLIAKLVDSLTRSNNTSNFSMVGD